MHAGSLTPMRVAAAYLELVDEEAPGLVEGLNLIGSAALGDYRPRTSDVDFVAVTANRLDESTLATLDHVHLLLRQRCPRPHFDGLYVTWESLAHNPAQAGSLPTSHEGVFRTGGGSGDPVTWHMLAGHGVSCRGAATADLMVWTDQDRLAAWTRQNATRYWRPLLEAATRPGSRWWYGSFTTYGAVWIVTGLSRLQFTLETGAITSKEGAALHVLASTPEPWRRVLLESLRIRRRDRATLDLAGLLSGGAEFFPVPAAGARSLYLTPLQRQRDVLAFGQTVVERLTS